MTGDDDDDDNESLYFFFYSFTDLFSGRECTGFLIIIIIIISSIIIHSFSLLGRTENRLLLLQLHKI